MASAIENDGWFYMQASCEDISLDIRSSQE